MAVAIDVGKNEVGVPGRHAVVDGSPAAGLIATVDERSPPKVPRQHAEPSNQSPAPYHDPYRGPARACWR